MASGRAEYNLWARTVGVKLREREVEARRLNNERINGGPRPPAANSKADDKPAAKKVRKGLERERFYKLPEWIEARQRVFDRDGRECSKCGSDERLNIDHILPRSKFKHLQFEMSNLRVLCWPCNKAKAAKIEST